MQRQASSFRTPDRALHLTIADLLADPALDQDACFSMGGGGNDDLKAFPATAEDHMILIASS